MRVAQHRAVKCIAASRPHAAYLLLSAVLCLQPGCKYRVALAAVPSQSASHAFATNDANLGCLGLPDPLATTEANPASMKYT